ncbi:hypothetical protein [Proteus mirabilis]|uniref:hypothetical protein n=1 Tax=Proteus mirabilis TaxID=584 RepID=UPI00235F383B|nr:hypothetical protein [Proteus mirabilis]MDC9754215.1 hypothetical protein [Proteus mirabilis]
MIEGVSSSTLVTLSDLVTIQAGYPFRGAIRDIPSGSVKAVQAKDISELGELIYSDLIVTDLTGKREPDWLKKGDILFSAKGAKHIASYVDCDLENTTCAPSLFLLHLKSKWQGLVNTQFLTWQLNHPLRSNILNAVPKAVFKLAFVSQYWQQHRLPYPVSKPRTPLPSFMPPALKKMPYCIS